MKVEIYFFNITKPNTHYLLDWIKKHDIVISKSEIGSVYDYRFEVNIMCYQLDELITIKRVNDLNYHIKIIEE